MKSNYDLVLEIIESYEDEEILNDFKSEFEEGKNVSKEDYFKFCGRYIDDMSEMYYIELNWKYIESGGDESVFDESEEDEDDDFEGKWECGKGRWHGYNETCNCLDD